MYFFHYYVGLPVAFFYSLLTSYFLLSYFQDKKKTNMFLFCIGVLHLSSLFIMPVLCFTIVLLPTNDLFFEYNEKAYSFIIEAISYTNHVLNKFIYPIIEIYLTSGYISARYKFLHISLKEWILNLNAYWLTVIGLIIHAIFVDFYENTLEFLLNYLNIMDLINV